MHVSVFSGPSVLHASRFPQVSVFFHCFLAAFFADFPGWAIVFCRLSCFSSVGLFFCISSVCFCSRCFLFFFCGWTIFLYLFTCRLDYFTVFSFFSVGYFLYFSISLVLIVLYLHNFPHVRGWAVFLYALCFLPGWSMFLRSPFSGWTIFCLFHCFRLDSFLDFRIQVFIAVSEQGHFELQMAGGF